MRKDTPQFVYSPQLSFWRSLNESILHPRFLYYWMSSEEFYFQFKSVAGQTDMAEYVSLRDQRQMHITLPPLPEQRTIAHILGTLDDKIELNRRMNETLEEMARALFKSWFVDFDPVRAKAALRQHAHHAGEPRGDGAAPAGEWTVERARAYLAGTDKQIVDLFPDRLLPSELGDIPEGWAVADIESLCVSITSGGTPARKNSVFWEQGAIPWYKTGELLDGPLIDSQEHITELGLNNSSAKLWPTGTILFALYASPTVGRLGVLTKPGTANQAAAGLIANPRYGSPFLSRLLIEARGHLQSIAVGSAQQNINQTVLKEHPVLAPHPQLASAYSQLIATFDHHQGLNTKESHILAALRAALLPKLVSGDLRVADTKTRIQ